MNEYSELYKHLCSYRKGDKQLPKYKELVDYCEQFNTEIIGKNIEINNLKKEIIELKRELNELKSK